MTEDFNLRTGIFKHLLNALGGGGGGGGAVLGDQKKFFIRRTLTI